MVNLYQLLNLPPYADPAMIQAVLQHAQATGSLEPKVIKAAQEWLLKPDVRVRYDAKLRQEQPEFFAHLSLQAAHAIPTPDITAFSAPETPLSAPPTPHPIAPTAAPAPSAPANARRKKTPVKQAIADKYGKAAPTKQRSKQKMGVLIVVAILLVVALLLLLV